MAKRLLYITEAHLFKSSLHHDLIQQVSTLEVVHGREVVLTSHLLILEEQVYSVYSHRLEVATEFLVANYLNQVAK